MPRELLIVFRTNAIKNYRKFENVLLIKTLFMKLTSIMNQHLEGITETSSEDIENVAKVLLKRVS